MSCPPATTRRCEFGILPPERKSRSSRGTPTAFRVRVSPRMAGSSSPRAGTRPSANGACPPSPLAARKWTDSTAERGMRIERQESRLGEPWPGFLSFNPQAKQSPEAVNRDAIVSDAGDEVRGAGDGEVVNVHRHFLLPQCLLVVHIVEEQEP